VAACKEKTVLSIHYTQKKKLADKLAGVAGKVADGVLLKLVERGQKPIL
jgi:serine protease SohB